MMRYIKEHGQFIKRTGEILAAAALLLCACGPASTPVIQEEVLPHVGPESRGPARRGVDSGEQDTVADQRSLIRCGVPSYSPLFWNGENIIQYKNNCYNYGNNKRTDSFAQPGRMSGAVFTELTCASLYEAMVADGLESLPQSGICPRNMGKVALVIAPGSDFHLYRVDSDGMWSHKPGSYGATNVDNSGDLITNPETANRGPYTEFCGYLCSCSDAAHGKGHQNIQ